MCFPPEFLHILQFHERKKPSIFFPWESNILLKQMKFLALILILAFFSFLHFNKSVSALTFDNSWYSNNCPNGTESIVSGVLQLRESAPFGNDNNYNYCTAQRGTYPWGFPTGTALPSGIVTVKTTVNFLSRTLLSGSRYHLFVAFYYHLNNSVTSPVTNKTYQWMDTQVRIENIGGTDSTIGRTETYDPGNSFGWDVVVAQLNPGQSYSFSTDVENQFQRAIAAYGIPNNTGHALWGLEIGTEAFSVQQLNSNWPDVSLDSTTFPSASFIFSPANPTTGQSITFTANATNGAPPYNYTWDFGDGSTGIGNPVSHSYSNPSTYNVNLTVKDANSSQVNISQPVSVSGQFDFSISLSSVSASINNGSSTQTIVRLALTSGSTMPVSFGASGYASGTTLLFSPTSCNPDCNSTLTIVTSSTTPSGSYPMIINANGGGRTHSAIFDLNIVSNSSATACTCTSWSSCANETQTRICNPSGCFAESQSCQAIPPLFPNITGWYFFGFILLLIILLLVIYAVKSGLENRESKKYEEIKEKWSEAVKSKFGPREPVK